MNQMESVETSQNGDCIDETSPDQLHSLEYSDSDDIFGDPDVLPRVGEEYQVKIPVLISKSAFLLYTRNPIDYDKCAGFPRDFLMGLPIPVMRITNEITQGTGESFGEPNDEPLNQLSVYRESFYLIVPGVSCDSWSDFEKESFLVGLYIFEKDFNLVKRFLEVKKMGDIMSYYYGKFYQSGEYKRWSYRNVKGKKCANGQRLFVGMRQQELLSRIFRHVSEESKNALREASKAFGEGKILLEEYVSLLKARAGIRVLVNSFGIGKGKQDLTAMLTDPSRTNQAVHPRPEIPVGKACASLTQAEIIKFLTGDFRLSKARSNDLFWEAVWPRLLARGWQSQERKDHAGSKQSNLVFIMPGIKKFSRRKLKKGIHYFDSVTDVLGKVASEPGILQLDEEEDEKQVKMSEDSDGSPEQRRHCYLQPRTPVRDADLCMFTVVDTSLNDGKNLKVRELRSLPAKVGRKRSDDNSNDDGSDLSTAESGSTNHEETNHHPSKRSKTTSDNDLQNVSYHGPDIKKVNRGRKKFKNPDTLCGVKPKITILANKTVSRRKLNLQNDADNTVPPAKRDRKLSSCSRAKTAEQEKQESCMETTDNNENIPNDDNNPHAKKRALIDLNLPIQPDFVPTEPNAEKNAGEQQQSTDNRNSRRHSTRNRPPTSRALEAIASGYLTVNRKPRGGKVNNKSRSSRTFREGEESDTKENGRNSDVSELFFSC